MKKVRSILFVCTGNTCRSPMAEALLRDKLQKENIVGIDIFSRGTGALPGQPLSEGTRDTLRAIGIEAGPHHSQRLEKKDIDRADQIFVMTESQMQFVLSEYPLAKKKTKLLADFDIADPMGGSPSDYEKCRIDIQNALGRLISKLKSEGSSKS